MSSHEPRSAWSIGRQPCANFVMRDEVWFGGNVHSCHGPYALGREAEPRCKGTVSLCESCGGDHHAGGWGRCPYKHERQTKRPSNGKMASAPKL